MTGREHQNTVHETEKALYGLMQASLLLYKKLRRELEDYGFVVNPYNPCVAMQWMDVSMHPYFIEAMNVS